MRHLLALCLLAVTVLPAHAQDDSAVKFNVDEVTADGLPADVAAALHTKLVAALNRVEAADESPYNVFHIRPKIDFTDVAETEGLIREVARVGADLTLEAVNAADGSMYHSVSIPLKGSAAGGKAAAMRQLVNSIKPTDAVFVRFIRTTRSRIHDQYAANCDNIIALARRLASEGRAGEATSLLMAVPPSVSCFDQAEALRADISPAAAPPKPDTVVIVEQVEVPVERIVTVPATPDTVVVEKVVERVVETPVVIAPAKIKPVQVGPSGNSSSESPAHSAPRGFGRVTVDGNDLDFAITSCRGDLSRRQIAITAKVVNSTRDKQCYVYLENAFTPSGVELTELKLDNPSYRSANVSMPDGVPVTLTFYIKDVSTRIDKLTYLGLKIRNIQVTVHDLPVRW
ncbi:MAG: hypothetical protein NC187_04050 [Candidatus Amulumruptor caecigallinarius]|nr:hypothetical protein [Candidatus Amulumruptor caecigallinarius]MCM1396644.1 hypothetical protein [Candidatus Amulumruptor caecigallinarius]MCM1453298.1 hypothetical protein [bacterium]